MAVPLPQYRNGTEISLETKFLLLKVIFSYSTSGLCLAHLVLWEKLSHALSSECIQEHPSYLQYRRAMTHPACSGHCHTSRLPLWWHLVAVTAQFGVLWNLPQKVILPITAWEIIPCATELSLPTKTLWNWISGIL